MPSKPSKSPYAVRVWNPARQEYRRVASYLRADAALRFAAKMNARHSDAEYIVTDVNGTEVSAAVPA